MVERDIAKNGVVLFAAVVGVVVVREEMTVLLLYECVVGETVMKLPLMSNTAKKENNRRRRIKEVMIVVVVVAKRLLASPHRRPTAISPNSGSLPSSDPFYTTSCNPRNKSQSRMSRIIFLIPFPVQIVDNERITKSSKKIKFRLLIQQK